MADWIVNYYDANEIEAAIEAIANTTTIHVIPISDGKEFMLIQSVAT